MENRKDNIRKKPDGDGIGENIKSGEAMNESLDVSGHNEELWFTKTRHAVYYVLGIFEVLLAFRLIFKMLGANTGNALVIFLYSMTDILVAPFTGIFRIFYSSSAAAQFVFEPATVISMLVYAVLAKGIVNLVRLGVTNKA